MKTNLKSKSETSEILKTISRLWNKDIPKIKNLKSHYVDNDSEILVGDNLKILRLGEESVSYTHLTLPTNREV